MKSKVTFALAQLTPIMGDTNYNFNKALEKIDKAAEEGAEVILFPEMFYCGYDVKKEELIGFAEPVNGKMFQTLSKKAKNKKIHIGMSYPELADEQVYLSFMFLDDKGNLLGNHRKAFMWKADLDRITPGNQFDVFDTSFGKVGLLICYEMEFPEPSRILTMKGAEWIFVTSAFMDTVLMEKHLSAIAAQNLVYVAGVNNLTQNYRGNSMVVDQAGNILAKASMNKEELLIVSVDCSKNRRVIYPAWDDFKSGYGKKTLNEYVRGIENM